MTPVGVAHATSKPITLTSTVIYRVAEGRIVDGWGTHDWLRLLQQFGAEVRLPGQVPQGESG